MCTQNIQMICGCPRLLTASFAAFDSLSCLAHTRLRWPLLRPTAVVVRSESYFQLRGVQVFMVLNRNKISMEEEKAEAPNRPFPL